MPAAGLPAEQEGVQEACYIRGRRELEHEFGKTMRYRSIRDLCRSDAGRGHPRPEAGLADEPAQRLGHAAARRPAVSTSLIFDEASQIPLEDAVPRIFRAEQVVVVGDEMQLPPTNFFSARPDDEERSARRG